MVVAFGTVFNNIQLFRYDQTNTIEIERINVPISYSNKEKFYRRISEDPNQTREVYTVLPRIAFEMTGLTYDPQRKISSHIDLFENAPPNSANKVKWTPYNFDFNLSIFVRNTEDGTQIIEQILPYFAPDYTVTIDPINMENVKLDIPILLNSVTYEPDYEGGFDTPTRTIIWNLNFTMKGYLFGPISQVSIIRKVTANVFDTIVGDTTQTLYLNGGIGNYRAGELVYQGTSLESSSARAYVRSWSRNNTTNALVVYDTTGQFKTNTSITGILTSTKYILNTYESGSNQVVNITVIPNPSTSNAGNAFGFTETIEESPNIT